MILFGRKSIRFCQFNGMDLPQEEIRERMSTSQLFKKGLIAGLPICLGYLSVSFGVGLLAAKAGMTVFQAVILSLSNLTSAGQAAGIEVIAASGTLLEIALTQFVINLRYALMGLSLSQKLAPSFGVPQRLLASYGITDEVFGVSAAYPGKLYPAYMYGMIAIATAGWTLGTFLGAFAGDVLPVSLTNALGIMLYGMFIAIIIPAAKKDHRVLCVILIAVGCSLVFHYFLPFVTSGFAVIGCALIASVIGALLFPVEDDPEESGSNALPENTGKEKGEKP